MIMNTQTQLIATYGCNKYQLGDKMRNSFHIPDEYLGALEVYKVVHMTGKAFTKIMFDGVVNYHSHKNAINYSVIYNGCTPYLAKHAVEIRLSFREAKPEFGLDPIVLVQVVEVVQDSPQ